MPFYDEGFKDHCISTDLKFAFLPKTCHISGKTIWLKFGYRQLAGWTGTDYPVFEYRWYDKHEFLIAKIMGNI